MGAELWPVYRSSSSIGMEERTLSREPCGQLRGAMEENRGGKTLTRYYLPIEDTANLIHDGPRVFVTR